jgi:hypothetical protein
MNVRRWAGWVLAATLLAAPPARRRTEPPAAGDDVLIVGAGLAGMSAAVQAASQGARVTLVEWSHVPGGAAIHADAARVVALHRRLQSLSSVRFLRSHRADRLVVENGTVTGVEVRDLRRDTHSTLRARSVILATGGFSNNASILRTYWPAGLAPEARFLLGGAWRARGLGLELALPAGAALTRMDRVWMRGDAAADPRDPESDRGLRVTLPRSLWLDSEGRRIPVLLTQPSQRVWLVFDSESKSAFLDALLSPADRYRLEPLLDEDNPQLRTSEKLDMLASIAGLPQEAVVETVAEYNRLAPEGRRIEAPPFYALALLPLAVASLGGLQVNENGQVLRSDGSIVRGLFAAGEAAGFGATPPASEKEFAARAEEMGRVVARAVIAAKGIGSAPRTAAPAAKPAEVPPTRGPKKPCFDCHDVNTEILLKREGWWHFERSHTVVVRQNLDCGLCHRALPQATYAGHHHQPADLVSTCITCHTGPRTSP